jgi:primosomal replication protein N
VAGAKRAPSPKSPQLRHPRPEAARQRLDRNRVVLVGTLIERKELRHTPAGMPAIDARIAHASQQVEAGAARQVNLEMDAVALGNVAERLSKAATGRNYRFEGFLAQRSRLSRQLILHLNQFELSED